MAQELLEVVPVCNNFVCHSLDIPPTILDIAGIIGKEFFQGTSLMPLLKKEKVGEWRKICRINL